MDLKSIADRLYGLRPTEFMAARTEYAREAKEAGEKDLAAKIAKLRKPSQSAWTLNLLARREPAELRRLGNLGAALRDAHGRFDGESIRELSKQRHQVIRALVAQVRSLAQQEGQKLSESVLRDVEAVFTKALTDPAVTETLKAGTLAATTDLTEQEGWPETTEPVLDEVSLRREQRAERRRQELGRAKAEAQHTSEVRDRAQNALAQAEQKAERAARSVQELEAELERARTAEEEANSEVRDARAVFRTAEKAAERARRQLENLES
jgi:DNA repair exonuclease SbcCD ATPase subunit